VKARTRVSTLAGLLALATGCGSSPEPIFYALSPTRGVVQAQAPAVPPPPASQGASAAPSGVPHAIRIRRPGLAGYLDRPEIVRRVVEFRLGVASNERWGEPLDMMVARVLAEDIQQRVPGASVFTAEGAITADPDATVEVDVQRFDVGETGEVNLVAQVAVERGATHTAAATQAVRLGARPKGDTTAALVATMSDLLGQMADQIAAMLRGGS
jgi:uncharacterized lipoprotein YmbA